MRWYGIGLDTAVLGVFSFHRLFTASSALCIIDAGKRRCMLEPRSACLSRRTRGSRGLSLLFPTCYVAASPVSDIFVSRLPSPVSRLPSPVSRLPSRRFPCDHCCKIMARSTNLDKTSLQKGVKRLYRREVRSILDWAAQSFT